MKLVVCQLPKFFFLYADQPQEFIKAKSNYEALDIHTQYEEVGTIIGEKYRAIFWIGEKTQEVEDAINDAIYKKTFKMGILARDPEDETRYNLLDNKPVPIKGKYDSLEKLFEAMRKSNIYFAQFDKVIDKKSINYDVDDGMIFMMNCGDTNNLVCIWESK